MVTVQELAARARPLGVLGGTFDPLHHGHLVVSEAVREALGLLEIVFIPSAVPPHKPPGAVTDARHRLAMVELATAGNPAFLVSDVELRRGGPSYTITTVRELREAGVPALYFILGADSLQDLPHWREPEAVVQECQVVVVGRPGCDVGAAGLPPALAARLRFLEAPLIDISATDIRARVASGRSIRHLVPDAVEQYIGKHRLYRESAETR